MSFTNEAMGTFNEEKIGILRKTTLVDYPGCVAAAIFLRGCNLHCRYCYNGELSKQGGVAAGGDFVTFGALMDYLKKRRGVIGALVISGGEALLNDNLPLIIKESKALGYKVKLDTNGTLPKKLKELLSDGALSIDYVAMDLKTAPARYNELSINELDQNFNKAGALESAIKESIKILSKRPIDTYEFRTVLVPGLVGRREIAAIAKLLPDGCKWYFSKFVSGGCLDAYFNAVEPYTTREINNLVKYAKSLVAGVILRT